MPKLSKAYPKYSLHKRSGLACVRVGGRTIYLGPHGSEDSRAAYDRAIGEWLAAGRRAPVPKPTPTTDPETAVGLTVNEVIVRYLEFAQGYYRKAGQPTPEVRNIKDALRPLQTLYGDTPAAAFGPRALKTVRAKMISDGLVRTLINSRVGKIARMFRWAGSEEMIPASVYHALQTVTGLRAGRSEARESEPVSPVPMAFVDAIRSHVAAEVWAMIELQRLTAMRPNEVVAMRAADLDMSGPVWWFRPPGHKMAHVAGRERAIALGPQAQRVLSEWLRPNLSGFLFSPGEAEARRKVERRSRRRTPVQPSQRDRSKRGARRKPGDCYTTHSYRRAIHRGCDVAGVPRWSPHRLRHAAATEIRKAYGLEAAALILGHAKPDTTLIYARADQMKAAEIMGKIG